MPLDTPQPPRIKRGEAHTVHTRGLTLLRSGHREIRKLKRANHVPTIHGNKVWNSSFLIMDQLTREKGPLRLTADSHLMDPTWICTPPSTGFRWTPCVAASSALPSSASPTWI